MDITGSALCTFVTDSRSNNAEPSTKWYSLVTAEGIITDPLGRIFLSTAGITWLSNESNPDPPMEIALQRQCLHSAENILLLTKVPAPPFRHDRWQTLKCTCAAVEYHYSSRITAYSLSGAKQ